MSQVYCSFCGRDNREVAVMLVAPYSGAVMIAICDECVDTAKAQVEAKLAESAPAEAVS